MFLVEHTPAELRDHTKLTFRFSGRNSRLADVYGEVIKHILAQVISHRSPCAVLPLEKGELEGVALCSHSMLRGWMITKKPDPFYFFENSFDE